MYIITVEVYYLIFASLTLRYNVNAALCYTILS